MNKSTNPFVTISNNYQKWIKIVWVFYNTIQFYFEERYYSIIMIMLAFILFHIITIFTFNIQSFHYIKKKIRFIASKLRKTKENKKDKKKEYSKKQISKINDIYIYKRNKNISNKQKPNNIKKSLDYEKIKIKSNYKIHNHDKIKNKENIKNYIDEEINGFSYSLALKYDKRTYCQYYISLLKTQHNLISALFNNNDYNSKIIKINWYL